MVNMAIVVDNATNIVFSGLKENKAKVMADIGQEEWQEAAAMCKWTPGHTQVALLADWGNGKVPLGAAVYAGFNCISTGGEGGFRVRFESDVDSLEFDNLLTLKKMCTGKTEDTQHTFQLLVLTVQEAQALLKKRKNQKQSIADVINQEEAEEEESLLTQ